MKKELFQEIEVTYCRFLRKFCDLPQEGNPLSLAYQSYHYNNFKALTTTLNDALHHVNYAQINTFEEDIVFNTTFNIVLDQEGKMIRNIQFDCLTTDTKLEINTILQKQVSLLTDTQINSNSYVPIIYDCLNNKDRFCMLYGTLFIDAINLNYVFNLNYVKILAENEINAIEKTKIKKDKIDLIYNQIKQHSLLDLKQLINILQVHSVSLDEFENSMHCYYGDSVEIFSKKEQMLKSLELILFTRNNINEIANACGYKSPISLYRIYHQSNKLNNNAIIRYAQ